MSIAVLYQDKILESLIREILDEGIALTTSELLDRYNEFVASRDLSKPLFNLEAAKVLPLENASAMKWNTTNTELLDDLTIAYKALFEITDTSLVVFDRWRTEIAYLEAQLKSLDSRISNLIGSQTKLNTFYISEDFVDTSKIDLSNTTAAIDLQYQTVTLSTSTTKATRISLNSIKPEDIQFTVLSRTNLIEAVPAPFGELKNAFLDDDGYWQSRIKTNSSSEPVTCELKVKLSTSIVTLNRIIFKLHSANTGSPVQITPLISTDGINYIQLPINEITLSVNDLATWNFPAQTALFVKFLITKTGYDFVDERNYIYEFGAENIAFYIESFSAANSGELVSLPLSVEDIDGEPIEFDKVAIEVCERLPEDTFIKYYVAPLTTITETPNWVQISHSNDTSDIFTKDLTFGNVDNIITSGLMVAYDATADLTPANFVNPSQDYYLITLSSGVAVVKSVTASAQRYGLLNSNERILNYELHPSINILDNSVEIFRNVGAKHDTVKIRSIQRGWGLLEPYYYCVIEITNENGLDIDFGTQEIIIDNVSKNREINIPQGIHTIKVHKNNWINVTSSATSLSTIGDATSLSTLDPLFPYNHKYLIEGYTLSDTNNPYVGADIFAQFYMSEVPVDDLLHSVPSSDYSKFAIDRDAIDTSATINSVEGTSGPNTIFVVKSDESFADFLDELFTLRFDSKSKLFKYIQFKAVLNTLDSTVAPNLDGYKLKLSY